MVYETIIFIDLFTYLNITNGKFIKIFIQNQVTEEQK